MVAIRLSSGTPACGQLDQNFGCGPGCVLRPAVLRRCTRRRGRSLARIAGTPGVREPGTRPSRSWRRSQSRSTWVAALTNSNLGLPASAYGLGARLFLIANSAITCTLMPYLWRFGE